MGLQHAKVAVLGFTRMQIDSRGTRGRECRGNVLGYLPGLAHAGGYQLAAEAVYALYYEGDGTVVGIADRNGGDGTAFGVQYMAHGFLYLATHRWCWIDDLVFGLFALADMRICQGISLDLAHHGQQSVGARGRQMPAQPDVVYEVQVGVQYFLRSVSAEDVYKHRYDALDDKCITIGAEHQPSVVIEFGIKPYTALTALDEVLRGLGTFGHGWQLTAQINDAGVTIHPIVYFAELLDDFLLLIFYSHFLMFISV